MKLFLLLSGIMITNCGTEWPDFGNCDKPDKTIEMNNGDIYALDHCWNDKQLDRHCCLYIGIEFPCEQTACSDDCSNYRSMGLECDYGSTPTLHLGQ